MRLLLVGGGAFYSIADVEHGYRDALTRAGHEVVPYALDVRIERAHDWLKYNYRRAKKHQPDIEKPTPADVIYQASQGVLERALRLNVDGVVIISGIFLHPDFLILLRRAGVRTALLLTESPYDDAQQACLLPYVDVAFTNERSSVAPLRQHNPETHYLPHAYDPAKHRPGAQAGDDAQPGHDVVFVGSYFRERLDLLAGVDWTGIDLGLYGAVESIPSRHRLRQFVRGGIVPNDQAAALYRRAAIGLNLYRQSIGWGRNAPRIDHAESLNPRAVELAACGVFHLSDRRAEVTEIFSTDVPIFTDCASLEARIRYYLAHPELRRIKAALLPSAIAHRTYDAGAATVVTTLQAVWSAHIHDPISA